MVTLRPEGPRSAVGATSAADTLLMDQYGMSFIPGLLVLRPGQTVEFRNSETEAPHNVRVRHLASDSTLFNVATVQGMPYRHRFDVLGGYFVTCDIHPAMDAALVVIDAPHFAIADAAGAFVLSNVPPGQYVARVWSMDESLAVERPVTVGEEELDLQLLPSG